MPRDRMMVFLKHPERCAEIRTKFRQFGVAAKLDNARDMAYIEVDIIKLFDALYEPYTLFPAQVSADLVWIREKMESVIGLKLNKDLPDVERLQELESLK